MFVTLDERSRHHHANLPDHRQIILPVTAGSHASVPRIGLDVRIGVPFGPMTEPIRVCKPPELLDVVEPTGTLFVFLGAWFDVPAQYVVDLSSIDIPGASLGDPVDIAAMAMRKLQALRHAASPGVVTASDVIIGLITELERVLRETPGRPTTLGRTDPRSELRDDFVRCHDVLKCASDAVGRLIKANKGAVLLLE